MKKLVLLVAVVAAVWALTAVSDSRKDVGELLPVQTLVVTRDDGLLLLRGDGGVTGRGATWTAAMEDLEKSSAGEAFFGCTGHVVVGKEALGVLPDALEDRRLRPAARLYLGRGTVEPETASAYLTAHPGQQTIQKLRADLLEQRTPQLPLLWSDEGRLRLYHG